MSAHDHGREPLPPSWIEKNQKLIIRGVVALALAAVVADVLHGIYGHKHVHFDMEAWPGFYAVVGFVSYVGLVLTAKQLRKVLSRPVDYYEEQPPLLAFDPAAADEIHTDDHDEPDDDLHQDDLQDEELHEEVTS
ncbi:MAG: hypothetical protein ACI9KE_006023 [Polyangiales bacterium]|jgi:hypothetical protein